MSFPSFFLSPLVRHVNDLTSDLYQRSAAHFNFIGSGFTKTQQGYSLELMVPGFHKEDIEILLTDNELTIKGQLEHKKQLRSFSQKWNLPKDANPDTIYAILERGVLTITMDAKYTQPTTRQISIH